jgi:hypothetical protein
LILQLPILSWPFVCCGTLAVQGGNQKAGPHEGNRGGSDIRENGLQQVVLHEVERQMVRCLMTPIKFFNGWDVEQIVSKGLDFIIPATILDNT